MHNEQHIPSTIAGYNVCERLGYGSFSNVFKAISASPSSNGVRLTVAVKVIDIRAANASKLASDCVVSEIKILKSLKHRNIVGLHEFQWDRSNIYLIMEFCGGGDLGSFIKHHGLLPEALTRRFFRQLGLAIQYMRAMNVAHMDLKPQNILLTNRYNPIIKVSDFGLSQYLKNDEEASSFRGSPLYMAPEILSRSKYDCRVDLWSCGVILYECLYGVPPFTIDDKLVEQILSQKPIYFPTDIRLSAVCLNLLQALLVRNPNRRISFEQFFAHSFVDLAKLPSLKDLQRADELVAKSCKAESAKNLVEATKYLSNAVQIYLGCLELLDDNETKTEFRKKIKNYLEHAESLKEKLRPSILDEQSLRSLDTSEWDDVPQVKAAQLIAKIARTLEFQEQWNEAFAKYTLAIEGAMLVLANENPSSHRTIILRRKVGSWLKSAEQIKQYIDVMSDDFSSFPDTQNDEAEKQLQQIVATKQCLLM